MRKVVVTGGAGFIGSNLVEELSKNTKIVVIDNLHSGTWANVMRVKNVEFICAESKNISNLQLEDIDTIFHLGIPSSSPMYKENPYLVGEAINGAIGIFEYAKNNDIPVVYASSSSLYNGLQPPHVENMTIRVTDYYTEARLGIERIAQLYNNLYNVSSVGLRFFSVFGPHEEAKGKYANIITQFLWRMKNNQAPVIYGDGEQSRDFVFVKDVVQACMLADDHVQHSFAADIFNVGTGISYSFNDIVCILNHKLDKNIFPIYEEMPMQNYVSKTRADISQIKILGYKPKYTLEQGIDQIL